MKPVGRESRTRVSIIIPVRNEGTTIRGVFESIQEQDYPAGLIEVVAADGVSTDGTREVLREISLRDPRVRVIENPGRTVAPGLNAALKVAKGDVIARMDAHTTYAVDYISTCVAELERTGADNVGGPWRARAAEGWSGAIAAAFGSPFCSGGARSRVEETDGPVDTVYLGCWPKATFERYGTFDDELVRNQDDEHNLRIVRGGGVVWQSGRIKSWYSPRDSIQALWRQYAQYGYWKVRVIQKHRVPASVRHLVPALFVLALGLGGGAAVVWPLLRTAYLAGIAVYVLLTASFSALTAMRFGWRLFPRIPVVFATYHLSYGWGFLRGLFDFVVARRGPSRGMTTLTRALHKEMR